MNLPHAARRVVPAAVALAAALALSACASGAPTSPPTESTPVSTPEDVGPNSPASSGGTATVVVDGVAHSFASENDLACMDANGVLVITLPMVSSDGEPTEASDGNLEISLVIPGSRAEGVEESTVRIRLPEGDGDPFMAGMTIGHVPEPITLTLDGQSVKGTQTLHHLYVDGPPSIEAHIDAVCHSVWAP